MHLGYQMVFLEALLSTPWPFNTPESAADGLLREWNATNTNIYLDYYVLLML